jgi:hypothetical protein
MRTVLFLTLLVVPAVALAQDKDLAPLIKKLKSTFELKAGAEGLGKLGAKARPALKDLGEALGTAKFDSDRVAIANAIASILSASQKEKADLVAKRAKAKGAERTKLTAQIKGIDDSTKASVASLGPALGKASFADGKVAIIKAIGAAGPGGAGAAKDLGASLKTGFSSTHLVAIKVLSDLGPLAKDAVPALTDASKTGFLDVRKAAAEALKKINK